MSWIRTYIDSQPVRRRCVCKNMDNKISNVLCMRDQINEMKQIALHTHIDSNSMIPLDNLCIIVHETRLSCLYICEQRNIMRVRQPHIYSSLFDFLLLSLFDFCPSIVGMFIVERAIGGLDFLLSWSLS